MERIKADTPSAADLAFMRMALRVVNDTIARLTPRKLKSFEELARLHDERRDLTRRLADATLTVGDSGQHELEVFYIVDACRALRVPALSGRKWRA